MHTTQSEPIREGLPPLQPSEMPPAAYLDWLTALRPRQWIKNFIIFAALLFTGRFTNSTPLLLTVAAFAIFCALSSAGYLINDLLDVDRDRLHPLKCRRPIAAGRLRRAPVIVVAVLLILGSLAAAFILHRQFALVALGYLLVTLTYTLFLKREVILDLFAIAAGFLLRALAGAVVLHVSISPWLFVCVSLLALLLGLGKRRHELVQLEHNGQHHRPVLAEYGQAFLDQAITIAASSALVTYAVYAISSPTAQRHHGMVITVPLVMYAILRYSYLIFHREQGGQPEEVFLTDRPLFITIMLWAVTVVIIYLVGGTI